MTRSLLLLSLFLPALAGAARFAPPLDEYEADCDRETALAREALKAFQAGHPAYETAVDLERTAVSRKAEADALRTLIESVGMKVNRYRKNLEGMEISYAAGALNGRHDPDTIVARFSDQEKTIVRLEERWRELDKEVKLALFYDHAAFKAESQRRKRLHRRRRLLAAGAGALLLIVSAFILYLRRPKHTRHSSAQPDRRHRPQGPARLQ